MCLKAAGVADFGCLLGSGLVIGHLSSTCFQVRIDCSPQVRHRMLPAMTRLRDLQQGSRRGRHPTSQSQAACRLLVIPEQSCLDDETLWRMVVQHVDGPVGPGPPVAAGCTGQGADSMCSVCPVRIAAHMHPEAIIVNAACQVVVLHVASRSGLHAPVHSQGASASAACNTSPKVASGSCENSTT